MVELRDVVEGEATRGGRIADAEGADEQGVLLVRRAQVLDPVGDEVGVQLAGHAVMEVGRARHACRHRQLGVERGVGLAEPAPVRLGPHGRHEVVESTQGRRLRFGRRERRQPGFERRAWSMSACTWTASSR